MIHILLLILKIIGIVLLAVFVLALLVLFFPIMYTAEAEVQGKRRTADVTAYWLFHIVHFRLKYRGDNSNYVLRVFGIPVSLSRKNKKSKKKKTDKSSVSKKEDNHKKDKIFSNKENNPEKSEHKNTQSKCKDGGTEGAAETFDDENSIEKSKKSNIIKGIINRLKSIIEKIKTLFSQVINNTKSSFDKIKEIKKFITDNTTKEAYNYGKRIVIKLIKHIFPKRIRADIRFGFEEPHITGQALGGIAMAFGTLGINPKKIVINPDFENKVFQCKARCRGHILLGVAGVYILKFYFKKEIHDIIKRFS